MDKTELNQIAALLEQASAKIAEFNKETYERSFQKYLDDNDQVWRILADIWNNHVPDREKAEEDISNEQLFNHIY